MSALIGVVLLISAVYALTAGRFAAMSEKPENQEEIVARIAPVGKVNLAGESTSAAVAVAAAPAAAPAGEGPGAAIYQKSCSACHAAAVAGAPKFGDKAAWEPRLAQGMDTLMTTAIDGKGGMPPRGTCADCSDEDLKLAIEYMLSKADLMPAPAAEAAPAPAPEQAPAAQAGMGGMGGMSGMEGMSGMSGMEGMGGMSGMEGMSGMSGQGTPAPAPEAPAPQQFQH
jgi:cytochrome c5